MSKYGTLVCPWCERPLTTDADLDEYRRRWDLASRDERKAVEEWSTQFCWADRLVPNHNMTCIATFTAGKDVAETRLIQVLEERDQSRRTIDRLLKETSSSDLPY